ncbi:MAG: carbohydrate-binding domain-containing protein [Candidatus Hodarchaeota archaeon]
MKKYFSILFILLIFQLAHSQVIFEDNFENYSIGSHPTKNWTTRYGGYSANIVTGLSISGKKSFRLVSQPNWARIEAHVLENIPDYVIYEGHVFIGYYGRGHSIGFGRKRPPVYYDYFNHVSFSNNGGIYFAGAYLQDWMTGTWYKVTVRCDFVNLKGTVWINDILRAKDRTLVPKNKFSEFCLAGNNWSGFWGVSVAYFDDIKIMAYYPEVVVEAEEMEKRKLWYGRPCEDGWKLTHHDQPIHQDVKFPIDSYYHFTVIAKAKVGNDAYPWMNVQIGDVFKGNCEVNSLEWKEYSFVTLVPAGTHRLSLTFLNDWWVKHIGGRDLLLDKVIIKPHYGQLPASTFTFEAEEMQQQNHVKYDDSRDVILKKYYSYVAQTMYFEQPNLSFEIIAKADFSQGNYPCIKLHVGDITKTIPVGGSQYMPHLVHIKDIPSGECLVKIKYKSSSWASGRNIYVDKLIIHSKNGKLLKPVGRKILNDLTASSTPESFELSQNHPNPFNSTTGINYSISDDCHVVIDVTNILGRKIRTLTDEYKTAGYYSINWNGKDDYRNDVPSGVYFYQLKSKNTIITKKMTLLR